MQTHCITDKVRTGFSMYPQYDITYGHQIIILK